MLLAVPGTIVLASTALLFGGRTARPPANEALWPTKGWATASPASVGVDEQVLLRLDQDISSGKFSMVTDTLADATAHPRCHPEPGAKPGEGPYDRR